MTPKQRMEVQNAWRSGEVQVVVATIAFGMGIDKANVRFVVSPIRGEEGSREKSRGRIGALVRMPGLITAHFCM